MAELCPGHFEHPFLSNLGGDKMYLEGLRDRLKSEFEDEPFVRRHAIMNLMGVVDCLLGDITEGKNWFSKVLKEDEENLNSLKNLEWADRKIGLKTEADTTKSKLETMLKEKSPEEDLVWKARALIEIARAACLTDQHHKQDDIAFGQKMFDSALALGKDNPDKDEYCDWKLGYAFHLMRMAKKVRNINKNDDRYFKRALETFYDVAKYCEGEVNGSRGLNRQASADRDSDHHSFLHDRNDERVRDMCGKAWAFAGVLLFWYKGRYDMLSAVVANCHPSDARLDGIQCLSKAERASPDCGAVLRRVAQTYMENKKLTKALETAEKAVAAQGIGFAYYVRGQIRLELYRHDESNRENLKRALEDLQKAHEKHFRPSYAVRDIAIALRYDGQLKKALEYFKRSEDATGGNKDYRMYLEWAKCLNEKGEYQTAEEKRQMADRILAEN